MLDVLPVGKFFKGALYPQVMREAWEPGSYRAGGLRQESAVREGMDYSEAR